MGARGDLREKRGRGRQLRVARPSQWPCHIWGKWWFDSSEASQEATSKSKYLSILSPHYEAEGDTLLLPWRTPCYNCLSMRAPSAFLHMQMHLREIGHSFLILSGWMHELLVALFSIILLAFIWQQLLTCAPTIKYRLPNLWHFCLLLCEEAHPRESRLLFA